MDLEKISSSIMGKYRPEAGGRAKDWLSEPGSVNLGAYLLTIGLGAIGVYCVFAAAFPELPVTKVA